MLVRLDARVGKSNLASRQSWRCQLRSSMLASISSFESTTRSATLKVGCCDAENRLSDLCGHRSKRTAVSIPPLSVPRNCRFMVVVASSLVALSVNLEMSFTFPWCSDFGVNRRRQTTAGVVLTSFAGSNVQPMILQRYWCGTVRLSCLLQEPGLTKNVKGSNPGVSLLALRPRMIPIGRSILRLVADLPDERRLVG